MITISLFYYYEKLLLLMNIWMIETKINETSLPEKDFYSHLNMEDITNADNVHAKRVLKERIQENIMICMFKATHYCQLMYLKPLEIWV